MPHTIHPYNVNMNTRPLARGAALLMLAALLLPVSASAGGLKLGKLFKMSKAQETEIAQEMNVELAKEPGLISEGRYYNQIQRVGKRLVEKNGLDEYDYQFFLIDQDEVNAFATPAGYIYVSVALMDVMAYDEAMLSGVMAHELGHAKDRHVAKGYEKMMQGALGFTVLDILLGKDYKLATDILFAGGQLVYLKYNRDQEEWADRYGVELNHGAGYDAYGLMRSLQCLEALHGSGGKIAEYMSTHPDTGSRIERSRAIAQDACGAEHGYLPIPRPPDKEHPLWELYGGEGPAPVVKSTQPVNQPNDATEIRKGTS